MSQLQSRSHGSISAVASRLRLRWLSSSFGIFANRKLGQFSNSNFSEYGEDSQQSSSPETASFPLQSAFDTSLEFFDEPIHGVRVRELPVSELDVHEARALGLI